MEQAEESSEELKGRGPRSSTGPCPSLTPAGGRLEENTGRLATDSNGRAGAHHRSLVGAVGLAVLPPVDQFSAGLQEAGQGCPPLTHQMTI